MAIATQYFPLCGQLVRGLLISIPKCIITLLETLVYPADFLFLRDFMVLIVSTSVPGIDFISMILPDQDFF